MKRILASLFGLWVIGSMSASIAKSMDYYSLHPDALQQAIANCEPITSNPLCANLHQTASRLNDLAYLLRTNPIEYGQQILTLQTTIVKQSSLPQVSALLASNQQNLREHLAIIKWLESPRS